MLVERPCPLATLCRVLHQISLQDSKNMKQKQIRDHMNSPWSRKNEDLCYKQKTELSIFEKLVGVV